MPSAPRSSAGAVGGTAEAIEEAGTPRGNEAEAAIDAEHAQQDGEEPEERWEPSQERSPRAAGEAVAEAEGEAEAEAEADELR